MAKRSKKLGKKIAKTAKPGLGRVVAHLKSGKCPKGAREVRRGKRHLCVTGRDR